MSSMTPQEIVSELDRHIVGQHDAKRAVAIALRNRWRRQQLEGAMKEEVLPKNILMIGPTGVGKTEVARRVARIVEAPFIKVEATKYTEVGYHGRDVESMIRDLLDSAISLVREEMTGAYPLDPPLAVDIGVRDTGVWVADAADGELARFDPATGDPTSSIPVGSPQALSIPGRWAHSSRGRTGARPFASISRRGSRRRRGRKATRPRQVSACSPFRTPIAPATCRERNRLLPLGRPFVVRPASLRSRV